MRRFKRKHKPRYPKGFDPDNPGMKPDPERWLPRYERKKYRKYMKKHGKIMGGSQGADAVDLNFKRGPSTSGQSTTKT